MDNFCSLESQDIDQKIILKNINPIAINTPCSYKQIENFSYKRKLKNIKLIEPKINLISNDTSNNIFGDIKPINIMAPLLFLTHINILCNQIK